MDILSFWRTNHLESLQYISDLLKDISLEIDKKIIIAKRLKRIPSIVNKLKRFNTMKITQMQDIAGCRAILPTNKKLQKMKRKLIKNKLFEIKNDYVKNPKYDGYRGIHLVCRCNKKENQQQYSVEVQLRTKVQHSWATAIEIIDIFEKQTLKTNDGKEPDTKTKELWLNFFKNISYEFSILEETSNKINNTYSLDESIRLIRKLNIHEKFKAYTASLKILESNKIPNTGFILIKIDLKTKTLETKNFPKDKDSNIIQEEYLILEKEAITKQNLIVALVSTKSIDSLKEAYPNYFADSKLFLENINRIELKYKMQKPDIIGDFLKKWVFN